MLDTNLQAVAVRLTLRIAITLCSLYIPPSCSIQAADLDRLVAKLPRRFLIMGDFNGHNPLWGSVDINAKGKILEDLLQNYHLGIPNEGSNTYLHPALVHEFTWSVHDDLCGSDHFPITRWKFHKADWDTFRSLCTDQLTTEQ